MSLFTDQQEWKPIEEKPTGNGDNFRGVDKFVMGSGSNRLEMNIKDGFWMGSDTFSTAKISMDFLGNAIFSSVTIKNENGDILIDSNSSTMDYVQIINTALNTSSKTILSDFIFEDTDYTGAFKAGNVEWSSTTGLITSGSGIVMNARGILGANSGVATFTLDATTGNATFAGTLSAASGTLGAITIGSNAWHVDSSGNMWWGSSSNYSGATIKISSEGAAFLSGVTISGSITATSGSIAGSLVTTGINADNITAGTVSGRTIKATGSDSGVDVWMQNDGYLRFRYNGGNKAYVSADSSGTLIIDSDADVGIFANDAIVSVWNDDGGSDNVVWSNDTSPKMALSDDDNLYLFDGSYL